MGTLVGLGNSIRRGPTTDLSHGEPKRMKSLHLLGVAGVAGVLIGCEREKPEPVLPARAVTVMEIAETDPAAKLRLPGSVAPWKDEEVAFQVAGRVAWVIEADQDVAGPRSDANYEPVDRGDKTAQLEESRYLVAKASAAANLEAAKARVRATSIQVTKIIPREIDAAKFERGRTESLLKRLRQAVETGSVAQSEVDDAQAAYDTAVVKYESLLARKNVAQVELELHIAKQQQAQELLNQADLDLTDTSLYAPFDARVSQVHVTPGTIVTAGTPVATLVVMDPVKVEVVVSAARDRQMNTNDEVLVHTTAAVEPIPAVVYQKSAVASSTTRTFTVTLLCRNRRIASGAQADVAAVPIDGFMRPQRFEVDDEPMWFIDEDCIYSDEAGRFAWRVVNSLGRSEDGTRDLQRINLKLGDVYKNFFGLRHFRQLSPADPLYADLEVSDEGQSDEGQDRRHVVLAAGVPNKYTGGKVSKKVRRWLLRPGDIVDVQLSVEAPRPGIYVRKTHIRVQGDKYFVFLVDRDESQPTARMIPINIVASLGDLHRIEGPGIEPGVRVITSGAHYLQDGEAIRIIEATHSDH